ncbi:hypothetical protein AALK46_12990 [Staphylococcus nepalensis]|uniref:hypothetical protein n=1 Tax=Staphylococcus nepalensis TaxID=214473 RepID=UPI0035112CC7
MKLFSKKNYNKKQNSKKENKLSNGKNVKEDTKEPNKIFDKERNKKLKEAEYTNKKKSKLKIRKEFKQKEKERKRSRDNYLQPMSSYDETGSFLKANNRYSSILKIVNDYGLNRDLEYGWFIAMIPEMTSENVVAHLFTSSKLMGESIENHIFRNKIDKAIKSESEENDTGHDTLGDKKVRALRKFDLEEASIDNARYQPAIDAQIYLELSSDDPDAIEEEIRKINTRFKDEMHGLRLDSIGGNQKKLFDGLLEPPKGSFYDFTWMSNDFGGNDHYVRRGLNDIKGVPIGELAHSYSNGTAIMELNNFRKRILIASKESSEIQGFDSEISSSSLWGQRVANTAMCEGDHRVFHIVLNGFKYSGTTSQDKRNSTFQLGSAINKQIKYFDLSKGGLNPMQMFKNADTSIEQGQQIFNDNIKKLIQMINLLKKANSDGQSSATDNMFGEMQQGMLHGALNRFYIETHLWDEKADIYPERIKVFNAEDPEHYPLMGQLLENFTNLVVNSGKADDSYKKRVAETLETTLDNNLTAYRAIFNRTTTLPKPNEIEELQVYYDLSSLSNNIPIMEAQFLNIFDYIATATKKDDIIMIHGLDRISLKTLQLLKARFDTAIRNGTRFAYLFDEIGNNDSTNNVDIFNTDGLLYSDMDRDFGYTILGTMSGNDVRNYEKKVNQTLTDDLRDILSSPDSPFQYQVRRIKDNTNLFIFGQFIV